jgi:alpha-tubulin suppressor-like RCC1 family protein
MDTQSFDIKLPHEISSVHTGKFFSLMHCKKSNRLFSIGDNTQGQCGVDISNKRVKNAMEVEIPSQLEIQKIVCGDSHSLFLSSTLLIKKMAMPTPLVAITKHSSMANMIIYRIAL